MALAVVHNLVHRPERKGAACILRKLYRLRFGSPWSYEREMPMKLMPIALTLALLSPAAFAKDKQPDSAFQDATLVSFRAVATGSSCKHTASTTGNVEASTDEGGNTTGTVKSTTDGNTNCRDTGWMYYTLQVGDHTYVVHNAITFGYRDSDLKGQLPGAHVLVRTDAKGFYVRVGNKESKFVVVEAK